MNKKMILNKIKIIFHKTDRAGIPEYESLTPVDNIKNGAEYMKALGWAISQDDIHNIAVSGPYGSGKSSVIESFLKGRKKNGIIRISLATFDLDKEQEQENKKDSSLTRKIEGEILKQLFYSVDESKIPQSRYRKIKKERWLSIISSSVIIMSLISAFIFFLMPDKIKAFLDGVNSLGCISASAVYLGIILFCLYIIIMFIRWLRKNGYVHEISLLDKAKFSNESGNEDSVFNKNLDEIIYFFEVTDTRLVVIEDLDRFESPNIFIALRDLNGILNNYENIKKPVKFLYAVKDDMFEKEGERTKFFDFIIPIVPYISSTNSMDILYDKLGIDDKTGKSKYYDISGSFIAQISPYISNMRDLLSICNEFVILKNTLKTNQSLELDDEKMFSMIVFKVLYPKEYANLEDENEESLVLMAFSDKMIQINNQTNMIESYREKENKKISDMESEVLKNIKELKSALIMSLLEPPLPIQKVNGYTLAEILKEDFDVNGLKGSKVPVICYGSNVSPLQINDIEKKVRDNGDYFNRIKRIQKGIEIRKEEIRTALEKYENDIRNVRSYSMKQCIESFGTNFLDDKVKKNDLLIFLLRRGYIDETYNCYINYFHPKSMSKDEMNFILGIRNRRSSLDYNFPLMHAEKIFNQLEEYEFKQKEVFNFSLVDFLIEQKSESDSMKALQEQLANHSQESNSFIKAYIERGNNLPVFIQGICNVNYEFWKDLIEINNLTIDKQNEFFAIMLKNVSIETVLSQNIECDGKPILTEFVSENQNILTSIHDIPVDTQIALFKELNVIFKNVEIGGIDEKIVEYIFNNNKYAINPGMIRRLFEWKAPERISFLSLRNYTEILGLDFPAAVDYIHEFFDQYVKEIILNVESNKEEDSHAVEDAIERLMLENEELCYKILDKEPVIWDNLGDFIHEVPEEQLDIKKRLWNYLLEHDRVKCSWGNFIMYFNCFGLEKNIIEYFDKNVDVLMSDSSDSMVTDDEIDALVNSDINDRSFEKLIKKLQPESYKGNLNDLVEPRIRLMIAEKRMCFSSDLWKEMESKVPCLRPEYAIKYLESFTALIDDIDINIDEINILLVSEQVTQIAKEKILSHINVKDIDIETANAILSLDFTIDKKYVMASWKVLSPADKLMLLLKQIDNFDNCELETMFSELPEEYSSLANRSYHNVRLEYNENNNELLIKLQEKGYITSYQEKEEKRGSDGDIKKYYLARVKQIKE